MTETPQHLTALARANEFRLERARYHGDVRHLGSADGFRLVAALLVEEPPCLSTLRVGEMLSWVHRVGGARARQILRRADAEGLLSERSTVGNLTARQRAALALYLREFDENGRVAA